MDCCPSGRSPITTNLSALLINVSQYLQNPPLPNVDRTLESEIELETASSYRLLHSLGVGTYGTAFHAVDTENGEPIEVRRLPLTLGVEDCEALAARVRLIGSLSHPAARRIRRFEPFGDTPTIVLDHGGDTTLANWAQTVAQAAGGRDVLAALLHLVECMLEAHHLGLTIGALQVETLGIVEELPQLDFTHFTARSEAASDDPYEDDRRDFARLLSWALEIDGVKQACLSTSHREAARLQQLIARQLVATPELPDFDLLIACLRAIVCPDGAAESDFDANSTSEINLVFEVPGPDESITRDVALASSEATAEVALDGPAIQRPQRQEPQTGDRLGRFQIEQKLGQGGMGAVFKAVDIGTKQTVAIKVLSQAALLRDNAVRRFAKEARLLASLNNPNITNLIEVSDEAGLHYIALEYVDGVDLGQVLDQQGPLKERVALAIAADVARALVDAHQREIVHRDIKPENILLANCGTHSTISDPPPRAKLGDFGIARHIDQSESLAVTQAGSLLGTPKYMSPEQCRGRGEVMPQSDVYSLGVTLFELLSGEVPFTADDPLTLAGKHCFDAPPSLRKLVPDLSEPAAELVAKCLAKRPEDRFADAGSLLRSIDRLLRGDPSNATLRPVLPPHDETRIVSSTMTWQLESSSNDLWPYVSNTERLNRSIGLPPVDYKTVKDPEAGLRRFGTIRLAGFTMSWEEHPFEWVEGRRMSVLREFTGGPFEWFVSIVELTPDDECGCELRHTIKIMPRNMLGKLLAEVETGSKCQRSLDKVYRRIDETIGLQKPGDISDAFEKPSRLSSLQHKRLLAGEKSLLDSGVHRQAANRLLQFLREAPEQEVAKIRPVQLARKLALDQDDLLEACFRAVTAGLLKLQWDLLCPTCRVAADTRESLREVEAHSHCEACDYDFKSDVADAVELVFQAHPEVRDVSVGRYCVGGPWHAPHVVAQLRIEPGERVETDFGLPTGDYVLRGPRLSRTFPVRVVASGAPSCAEVVLATEVREDRTLVLRAGGQSLSIENDHTSQQVVRLERTIPRDDVLTAARASATPRFRELFPAEVFESGQLVSAEKVSMLTAALPAIDDLYTSLGDAEAYTLVERYLTDSEALIRSHGGEVVKVVGETIVATFHNVRCAVEAAFALGSPIDDRPFQVAVGVHLGSALVTTANNRLDYFGAVVRQATALPTVAGVGVTLTEPVISEPETATWLSDQPNSGRIRTLDLPGKPKQVVQFYATQHERDEELGLFD